ncbi:glycosyltransferase, partial [Micromonospora sp. NPDC049559]|uniref:glycosyltransferase n=1 Tax=Micromonospora sp. NPDC049559 TaxID=3155923 RepID=UPI003432E9FA
HLIAGLPRLRQAHPDLRVVIAGDGPYRGELQAQAHGLGVGGMIQFPGFLGGVELPAMMAASDCFAVPSIYEPFGMVALEGAAAGAPLAVSATGGLAEIVQPGVTGVTFQPKDPDGLADAVHSLLANGEHARQLARRARTMVDDEYGWASIAHRTAAAYSAAIAQNPAFTSEQAALRMASGRMVVPAREGNLLAAVGGR